MACKALSFKQTLLSRLSCQILEGHQTSWQRVMQSQGRRWEPESKLQFTWLVVRNCLQTQGAFQQAYCHKLPICDASLRVEG